MKHAVKWIFAVIVVFGITAESVIAGMVTTKWGGSGEMVYDSGFMHMLMRHQDEGACLFNMELIENDAAGSGRSEKGVSEDVVWGENWVRKVLYLEDVRTLKAWLVTFSTNQGAYPLRFKINGQKSQVGNWDINKCREMYRWTEFPAEWLKKGKNVIDLYCPEAQSEKEGWGLYIARADEFEHGGGDPAHVGETSFKSTNGGRSWKRSPFGLEGKTSAEYSVRFSLDRYVKTGWLESPVIDLWKGDSQNFIVPLREIQKMRLTIESEVPSGTKVEYFFRRGKDSDPFGENWESYRSVGEGALLNLELEGMALNRRFVQFKTVLSTSNPLKTPVVKSANITAELLERIPLPQNVHIVEVDNPPVKYASINWEWEKWDRTEFKEIRERENLDEVVAGSRTQFDAQVKLLDYTTKRWRHCDPGPEYPGWDALSILERIEYAGGGGMCIQFNNTLAGLCMAYGWQARLVNVVGHEICEVWNDEFGKWIFLDADYENLYNYDPETAEPLNMLELHYRYLDYYFPGRSINWMTDMIKWFEVTEKENPPVRKGSLTHHKGTHYTGLINAAFMRMVPRNNWYEKPYPVPLTHGRYWWPWDGYINWYDERTPPKRQYSWHTDRPRDMWPDLNKVHIDATSGFGNDRLFLRFETYTPNFCHFEINVDDTGWKKAGERYTWLLGSGRNTISVRAVNKLGARGKPSTCVLNHADAPFAE